MKMLNKLFGVLAIFLLTSISVLACDINFDIQNGKKASYAKNDELVAKITVVFTHRSCPEGINKTQLKPNGLEILSATKWTEKTPGTWERKVKIKVTEPKGGKATLQAVRVCDKDGGSGTLTLIAK